MSDTISPSLPLQSAPATAAPDARKQALPVTLIAPLVLWVAILCVIAWPMLQWWYWEYSKPESYYGYAWFVPFFVGVMLWHRRESLASVATKPFLPALLLVVPALFFLILAIKTEMQAVMSTCFLLTLIGGVWSVFGTAFLKRAWFPLGFLWLMAPLPGPVLNDMTIGVQQLSTTVSAKMLTLIGMHPHREGNIISLENFTMHVDVPCSGFKLLLTLMTFSIAFAYLTDTTMKRRWILFLFSLPLAVAINAVRITMFGIVGECFGASAAHAFHDWSGMIGLVLCMGTLFGVAKALGCRTFAGQRIF